MSKNYLKNLDWIKGLSKIAKSFYKRHKKNIVDVILYGSSVRGKYKPRDIDIILVLKNISKSEYFDLPYELRKQMERRIKVDVKGILIEELLDPKFLARQGLLIEGYSLIKSQLLSERLGFESYSLFVYSIKNLSHNGKTKFQYALKGRGDRKGMLHLLEGNHIGIGTVLTPIQNSEKFKDFLDEWKIRYEEWRGIFVKS